MVWSQFSIKTLEVYFGSFGSKKIQYLKKCNSLWEKKTIVNQILLSELWYVGQIYTTLKFIIKELGKAIARLPIW